MEITSLDFVHRFVPATRPGLPVLLLLHGTGGTENDLIDLGHALLPGSALLSPRGKVLENGMSRFFRRLTEGVFDVEDLKARALQLGQFVENAHTAYDLGQSRIIAIGYSNGANIGSALLLARPDLLDGCCLFRPMVPYQPEQIPDLTAKTVCVLSGRFDRTMSPSEPIRLKELFESAKANTEFHTIDAGHELTAQDVQIARNWLAKQAGLA